MAKDEFCDDCYYYRNVYPGLGRCCHYILMTDKKRPCDPGKGCTVKVKTKVNRRKKKGNIENVKD
jgi:hypothetical protein